MHVLMPNCKSDGRQLGGKIGVVRQIVTRRNNALCGSADVGTTTSGA
jgi:hypothetical protein